MNAGVIIVTCNRIELLKECLNCVLRQTMPFAQICVVDNAGTDGSGTYLDRLADTIPLTVLHLPRNLGGAGGFACGLRRLVQNGCDWLLLIDDDAMLRPDYLEKLAQTVEGTDYLACSGTVMSRGVIDTLHRRRLANRCLMTYRPVAVSEYRADTFSYDIGTFCGLMLRTDLISRIGFPKREYFIWFDDTEYCLRFRKFTSILNVNGAVLDHRAAPSQKGQPVCWKNYYGFRNAIDIGKTYSSDPGIFMAYTWINHLAHILIDSACILLGNRVPERTFRRQIYIDVLRGRHQKPHGRDSRYLPEDSPGKAAASGSPDQVMPERRQS